MSSLALLLLFLAANTIDGARDKPNILLLLADDMGWGDLGANLPHLPSSTPFLDKLANSGIRFQDFHSGSSVCTPSRSALLTGRLGQRTGVLNNFGPDSVGGLPETEITIAKILKEAGYRTAALGKWHLGLTQGHHPLDHGFDRYFGVPYSLDMGCSVPPGLDMPPKRSCIRNLNNGSKEFSNTPLPLYKDRDILHQPVKLADLAQLYAEFGTNFVNEDKNVPFFLLVAFSHVHVPLAHGNNFSNATNGGVFENCLREMDWIAEELVRAAGLENTLIWFLSDNGPWQSKCNLAGSAGPYKGVWQQYNAGGSAKRTVWEGGHRVPAFINWAPVIKSTVSSALLSALDVVPTISSLTGAKLPSHHFYDGLDISTDLLQGHSIDGHQVLLHPSNAHVGHWDDIGAVRVRHMKAVFHSGGVAGCVLPEPPFRFHYPPLVFDIAMDPEERFPLHGTRRFKVAEQALQVLDEYLNSVQKDNTSVVDTRTDPAVRPCCSHYLGNCFCPWDEPI